MVWLWVSSGSWKTGRWKGTSKDENLANPKESQKRRMGRYCWLVKWMVFEFCVRCMLFQGLGGWMTRHQVQGVCHLFTKRIYIRSDTADSKRQGYSLFPHCYSHTHIYIYIYIYGFLFGSVLSCFSHVQLFATLWTIAHKAALSKRFSRQEYWSRLPCPLLGDLPNQGIETSSL